MTEEEWLTTGDPTAMLSRQRSQSERKLQLFACACSHRIVPLFRESERVLQFIEAVETLGLFWLVLNQPSPDHIASESQKRGANEPV